MNHLEGLLGLMTGLLLGLIVGRYFAEPGPRENGRWVFEYTVPHTPTYTREKP